jgi:hypothetical protein
MLAWIIRLFARRAPDDPHFYSQQIEKHLRELGLSPFAEELQNDQ